MTYRTLSWRFDRKQPAVNSEEFSAGRSEAETCTDPACDRFALRPVEHGVPARDEVVQDLVCDHREVLPTRRAAFDLPDQRRLAPRARLRHAIVRPCRFRPSLPTAASSSREERAPDALQDTCSLLPPRTIRVPEFLALQLHECLLHPRFGDLPRRDHVDERSPVARRRPPGLLPSRDGLAHLLGDRSSIAEPGGKISCANTPSTEFSQHPHGIEERILIRLAVTIQGCQSDELGALRFQQPLHARDDVSRPHRARVLYILDQPPAAETQPPTQRVHGAVRSRDRIAIEVKASHSHFSLLRTLTLGAVAQVKAARAPRPRPTC